MISLLMKFSLSKDERMFFIGIVIIAANAGGAWSPIGDVTTTMLWMNGHITSTNIIKNLFLPGLICAVIPLLIVSFKIKGQLQEHTRDGVKITFGKQLRDRNLIFIFGITMLLLVPLFKSVTHLPPFMGMLLALGMLWIVTEIIHAKKNNFDKRPFSAVQALTRIDIPSVLFFLGILISISALDATGILGKLSIGLDKNIGNVTIITLLIGFLSALIDNVPLVAAAMGTYGNGAFGVDHHFWTFLSYCAGTGGSALIIGSAAGVAAMGIAQIPFFWYLRKITPIALAGYLAGAGTYLLQTVIFH
jgi:Na+/H+ antiporter NhaD/arsenite permease-like protein